MPPVLQYSLAGVLGLLPVAPKGSKGLSLLGSYSLRVLGSWGRIPMFGYTKSSPWLYLEPWLYPYLVIPRAVFGCAQRADIRHKGKGILGV
eukprot:6135839-Amphidinium_carterae.1